MPISIKIPDTELWDPTKEEFIQVKGQVLTLEHSLLSVDKRDRFPGRDGEI